MEPVLVAKNLSKKYGTVVALESADSRTLPWGSTWCNWR